MVLSNKVSVSSLLYKSMKNIKNLKTFFVFASIYITIFLIGVLFILTDSFLNWERCEKYLLLDEFSKEREIPWKILPISHRPISFLLVHLGSFFLPFLHSSYLSYHLAYLILFLLGLVIIGLLYRNILSTKGTLILLLLLSLFSFEALILRVSGTTLAWIFFAICFYFLLEAERSKKEKYIILFVIFFLAGSLIHLSLLLSLPIFLLFFLRRFYNLRNLLIFSFVILLLVIKITKLNYGIITEVEDALRPYPFSPIQRLGSLFFRLIPTVIEPSSPTSYAFLFLFIILPLLRKLFAHSRKNLSLKPIILSSLLYYFFLRVFWGLHYIYVKPHFLFLFSLYFSLYFSKILSLKKKVGVLLFFFFLFVALSNIREIAENLSFRTKTSSIFMGECYDTLEGIAKAYEGEEFERVCENLGENKYFCYKGYGKYLARNLFLSPSELFKKCKHLRYKEWCDEGVKEELSFHFLNNMSLEKNIEVYQYRETEWSHLSNLPFLTTFDLKKPEFMLCDRVGWRECYESLSWVYVVVNYRFVPWAFLPGVELVDACSELNRPYSTYCFVGMFKLMREQFPFFYNFSTCNYFEGECKYACYLGVGKKVGEIYSLERARKVCEYLSEGDNEFRKLCEIGIGLIEGKKRMYEKVNISDYPYWIGKGILYSQKNYDYFSILKEVIGGSIGECMSKQPSIKSKENITVDCKGNDIYKFVISDSMNIEIRNCNIKGLESRISNSRNIVLKNIIFENGERGITIRNSQDLYFKNLIFTNLTFHGIHLISSKNFTLENSKFENIEKWDGLLIRNSENVRVENNLFRKCWIGINIEGASNLKITNNTFEDSPACILVLSSVPSDFILLNNTFSGCGNYSRSGTINLKNNSILS